MKKLIIAALVLLVSIAGKGQSKAVHPAQLHFLIGAIGTEEGRPGVWAGGLGITIEAYPNRVELVKILSEKLPGVKDIKILSITPMTSAEFKAFWRESDSSSNKKGGKP